MNKMLIIGVIAILLIGGGVYVAQSRNTASTDSAMTNTSNSSAGTTAMEETQEASQPAENAMEEKKPAGEEATDEAGVKTFTVTGSNFKFEPNTLTVKKGDKVKIIFKNSEGFHDWVIDDLGVKTQQIKSPAEETVEFTADKAGSFEYYCSVGKHREMGMKGTLTVTE